MTIGRTVVGVDTAKRVFQLHWVDLETGEIVDLKLTRARFLDHFANRVPCLIAMEACGGSQHWARRLKELGHEVRLLPAKMVRPFVGGNKNDSHDARAIWTAAQQPGVKTVAIKTEEQQAILALHRMRQQLVKFRTAQINCLRGLLTEYGEVMPQGWAGMRRGMGLALERVSERLPAMVVETLREQWARVTRVNEEIGEIERRLKLWHRDNAASRIMNTSTEGFRQCYNAQTAVDEAHQIIVATQVGAQASDQGRLMPLLDEVSDSFGVEPEVVLADAGYCNEADLVALEERGIDGYVALGREGKARVAVDPHTRAATHRMGEKLARAKGKAQYAKRKWMSEGPNGWVKEVLGFRRFSLRGLDKVRGEWHLVCLALNIRRLAAMAA